MINLQSFEIYENFIEKWLAQYGYRYLYKINRLPTGFKNYELLLFKLYIFLIVYQLFKRKLTLIFCRKEILQILSILSANVRKYHFFDDSNRSKKHRYLTILISVQLEALFARNVTILFVQI